MNIASKKSTRRTLSLVLTISIALHVLGLFIFGIVKIAQTVIREEVAFVAPPLEPPPEEIPEYEVNLEQRNEQSAPPRPNPIVVDSPDVSLPALDIDINVESSSSYGRGGGGFGNGTGSGSKIREMSIDLTKFGYSGFVEGTLEGTLFDLKHSKSGKQLVKYDKAVELEGHIGSHTRAIVHDFSSSSWSISSLRRKYKAADQQLYGSFFVIPYGKAADAPKAFNAEKEISPKGIMAVYAGSFTPPKTGRFRFVGKADDVILVRVRKRLVLDGSWGNGFSKWDYEDAQKGPGSFFGMRQPAVYGDWIDLEAGTPVDIEVLIAEAPGGWFGAYLLIQEEGKDLEIFSTKSITSKEKRQLRDLHKDSSRFL